MKISFITISWNTCEKTCACVASLRKYMPEHEVIVVDNNSADDSCEQLKKRFPDLKLIENADNRGFGAANNQGAEIASGDVLCFINSDTEVLNNGLVRMAERLVENKNMGIVGPRIVFGSGKFQHSYGRFADVLESIVLFGFEFFLPVKSPINKWKKYNLKEFKAARTVDWVSGCCLMIEKKLFNDIGCWDERYFAYYEDPALCRSVWLVGKTVWYDPSVEIIHHHGASFSQHNWVFRIKNNIKSSCIFLFDSDQSRPALGYKLTIRMCWMVLILITIPFCFNERIREKRKIIKDLFGGVRVRY